MTKKIILIACLSGASAVILGAFGAHILEKILSEKDLATFKTGVDYQFYHTFAILLTAILGRYTNKKWSIIAAGSFITGIVFFSGSLYLLATAYAFELESFKPILGPMTPIGGILFIFGWLALFYSALKYKDRNRSSRSSKQ